MKLILLAGGGLIVALLIAFFIIEPKETTTLPVINPVTEETTTENGRIPNPDNNPAPAQPIGKLKADTFTGTLEKVDTGCFSDGECYVEVDGKHVTVLRGWSQDIVGSVQGTEGIGGLEIYIGKQVEVYAQDLSDGTFTLYGSAGFYIKPLTVQNEVGGACVVGGCSSQLCSDASEEPLVSTCLYKEEYACYKTATCERQKTGQCGWTETTALNQCLKSAS